MKGQKNQRSWSVASISAGHGMRRPVTRAILAFVIVLAVFLALRFTWARDTSVLAGVVGAAAVAVFTFAAQRKDRASGRK